MYKPSETIIPCEVSLRSSEKKSAPYARIAGITAIVSFSAGLLVGSAYCSETPKEDTPSDVRRPDRSDMPAGPAALPVSPEQQEIQDMLFPETNDLLYHPAPDEEEEKEKSISL